MLKKYRDALFESRDKANAIANQNNRVEDELNKFMKEMRDYEHETQRCCTNYDQHLAYFNDFVKKTDESLDGVKNQISAVGDAVKHTKFDLGAVADNIGTIKNQVGVLNQNLVNGIGKSDERFDVIDNTLEELNGDISELDSKIVGFAEDNSLINDGVNSANDSLNVIDSKVDDANAGIDAVAKRAEIISVNVSSVLEDDARIESKITRVSNTVEDNARVLGAVNETSACINSSVKTLNERIETMDKHLCELDEKIDSIVGNIYLMKSMFDVMVALEEYRNYTDKNLQEIEKMNALMSAKYKPDMALHE